MRDTPDPDTLEDMTENHSPRPSRISEILKVLSDHAELASVEAQFEAAQASRRLLGGILAAVFALAAFTFVQFSLVAALMALGLRFGFACLSLAGIYALCAAAVWFGLCRRDAQAGRPFDGTRRELGETLEWIHKLFS